MHRKRGSDEKTQYTFRPMHSHRQTQTHLEKKKKTCGKKKGQIQEYGTSPSYLVA